MEKGNGTGISFLGALTILFIGLKLTGFIDWSWLWVLAPIWGGFAFVLICAILCAVISTLAKTW